ncbi:MAG: hypothetical protein H6858_03755 [Rhodospirillales bacterium]|nr:hypothetical protein [Rhodospirillales bacterium]
MAHNFKAGGPVQGVLPEDLAGMFMNNHPELAGRLKSGFVSRPEDAHLLNTLIRQSSDLKYGIAFFLRKYLHTPMVPKDKYETTAHAFGVRWTDHFISQCFLDKKFPYAGSREEYLDAFLAFMADKPKIHKGYFDTIRAWEMTDLAIAHASAQSRKGGSGGHSGDGSGGDNGQDDGPSLPQGPDFM